MSHCDPAPLGATRRTLLAYALGLGISAVLPRGARAGLLSAPASGDTVAIEVFAANGQSKGTVTVRGEP